jgi:ATP dependent DNA ligase domain
VIVPTFQPLTLGRAPAPFSHRDWLFEIKWNGFRSLVRIEQGKCRLISRNGNEFKSFRTLNESVLSGLKVKSAVLDGEIVCLNDTGKTEFRDLLFRRGQPRFVAFDLLWCDGQDLRYSPLTERKHRLRSILPKDRERLMYCDPAEHDGESLFRLACETILKALLRSGNSTRISRIRLAGSKSGIRTIRSGWAVRNFSTASGRATPTCPYGMTPSALVRSWTMRNSSCQIEFADGSDSVRCGKPTLAECADCGIPMCADCRRDCCGESFCEYCYEYHLTYSCLRKPARTEQRPRAKDAA